MDDATFDALVRRHARAVSAYARAIAPDRWVAEEAVQDAFVRAWKYLDTFDERGSFEGWLIRICRNCVIDLASKARPAERLDDHVVPPSRRQAHDEVELHDLLARIPAPQREALVLCTVLGYEYEEAAALLDVPVGTIRSRVHRARQALADQLDRAARDTA